jgi:hypothetical protein
MRETCTSGSVRGEGGNILTYSAQSRLLQLMTWRSNRARLCPRGQAARSDSAGKGA